MGLFERVERGLERAVNGAFARAFKAEVQPVEIAAAMRRAMDDRAAILGHGRTIVPNLFSIELAESDYQRLTSYAEHLTDELVASAQEHAESQRYQPGGPIQVQFAAGDDLETGVFRVRTSTAKAAPAPAAAAYQPAPLPQQPQPQSHQAQPQPAPEPWAQAYGGPPAAAYGGPPAAAYGPPEAAPAPPPQPAATQRSAAVAPPARPRTSPAERPWLDVDGERYPLLGPITVLGRDDSADVVLDDPGISRRHTEIRVTSDGPHLVTSIRDLGSTNGTFVNGERIGTERLQDGDRVTFGRTTVTFRAGRR